MLEFQARVEVFVAKGVFSMKKLIFDLQRFVATISGSNAHDYLQVSVSGTIVYGYGGNDTVYNHNHNNVTRWARLNFSARSYKSRPVNLARNLF